MDALSTAQGRFGNYELVRVASRRRGPSRSQSLPIWSGDAAGLFERANDGRSSRCFFAFVAQRIDAIAPALVQKLTSIAVTVFKAIQRDALG
jgi:hypothetical protein